MGVPEGRPLAALRTFRTGQGIPEGLLLGAFKTFRTHQ